MDISAQTLSNLYTGYRKNFADGFAAVKPLWQRVATRVPSSTESNSYPWLGDLPGMRKWIGDREIKRFGGHDYTIKNEEFEQTVGVPRKKIEDDQYGVFAPFFTGLGQAAAQWPDELVWAMLAAGFSQLCYDGQYFFDTDHPVGGVPGIPVTTVSNMQAGGGNPWFLLDTRKPLLPLIFQERKKPDKLIRLDKEEDTNVFMRGEFLYGADGRGAAGFGFWQLAYASKGTCDGTNFKAARLAMESLKKDNGQPLGVSPNLVVCGTSNRDAATDFLTKEYLAGGETNPLRGAAELLVVPWLA